MGEVGFLQFPVVLSMDPARTLFTFCLSKSLVRTLREGIGRSCSEI